jgi:hypothetical protein
MWRRLVRRRCRGTSVNFYQITRYHIPDNNAFQWNTTSSSVFTSATVNLGAYYVCYKSRSWFAFFLFLLLPITVVERSKAWTVFVRWNTGIVGSHSTQVIDVCVRLSCVCFVSGLETDWSPVQGVLPTVCRIKKLKTRPRPNKGLQSHRQIISFNTRKYKLGYSVIVFTDSSVFFLALGRPYITRRWIGSN